METLKKEILGSLKHLICNGVCGSFAKALYLCIEPMQTAKAERLRTESSASGEAEEASARRFSKYRGCSELPLYVLSPDKAEKLTFM